MKKLNIESVSLLTDKTDTVKFDFCCNKFIKASFVIQGTNTISETSATMPSTLPDDKQAQLITAAYQCCTEIGE